MANNVGGRYIFIQEMAHHSRTIQLLVKFVPYMEETSVEQQTMEYTIYGVHIYVCLLQETMQ